MDTQSYLKQHFAEVARRLLDSGEKLMPLGKLATFLNATRGARVHPQSLSRWIIRGKSGIRLEALRMNGDGWHSSREAMARFFVALSAKIAGEALKPLPPSESELERRDKLAKAKLRSMGVKC